MSSTSQITGLASHLIYHGLLEPNIAVNAYKNARQQNIPFISHLVKNKLLDSSTILNGCVKTFGLSSLI